MSSYNSLAWILSTCPEDRFRNGQQAISMATRACELTQYRNADYIATLAAAHAEAGDFQTAIQTQLKAVEVAPNERKEAMRQNIEAFQNNRPLRDDGRP